MNKIRLLYHSTMFMVCMFGFFLLRYIWVPTSDIDQVLNVGVAAGALLGIGLGFYFPQCINDYKSTG